MAVLPLRLRWALRDLKSRWLQVAGIAFMLAIGTGLASGLASSTQWRMESNEASIELTNMYDLRARLGGTSTLPAGSLVEVASGVHGVRDAEERLIFESQIEIATPEGIIVIPSRIVGVDMSDGGPHVNGVMTAAGRGIEPNEFGEPVVLIERNFGLFYDVPDQGELRLAGGTVVRYVGHAMSPEYFLVVEDGSLLGQANLAVLFTSLETAQFLADSPGMVNDLIMTLQPDADIPKAETELLEAFRRLHTETSMLTSTRDDDAAYVALTQDVEGDQAISYVVSGILFAGAAFAALNFAARVVETQRREIGTAMALGLSPLKIALRPILLGIQIAVLGVAFGIAIGWLVSQMIARVIEDFVVLPVFSSQLETGVFIQIGAVGVLVPIVAVIWPVYRAVRVQPVEAIKTGHLASRGGGIAPMLSRLPLPGGSVIRMPFRNLLRAPRRTILTLLAISTVLAILFAMTGMRDSFLATLEQADEELLAGSDDRLIVQLDTYYAIDSDIVTALLANESLSLTEPVFAVGGSISVDHAGGQADANFTDLYSAVDEVVHGVDEESLEVQIQFVDFQSGIWASTAHEVELEIGSPSIVLARKAVADLRVGVGDELVLTHPKAIDEGRFTIGSTRLHVIGIHSHPLRSIAYIDIGQGDLFGLAGLANGITGVPAEGSSLIDAKRDLFEAPGVATVQGFAEGFKAIRDIFEQFAGIFTIINLIVLGLALVIAFNTASINVEERARDHATMFAYGVGVSKVVLNLAVEGLILGVSATVIGAALGTALLLWIIHSLVPNSYPELGIVFAVAPAQLAMLLALAIAVITFAPVLNVRKLRRMNIPDTLRVQE
jgi:putative ABC transport system permease protein